MEPVEWGRCVEPAVGEAGPRAPTKWRGGLGIKPDGIGRTPSGKAEG